MINDDVLQIVLQFFADKGGFHNHEDIVDELSLDKIDVLKSLSRLTELGLLVKDSDEGKDSFKYKLVSKIKAINLARAAQFGIDLYWLDQYIKIDKEDKELALKISTKADNIKNLESSQKPLLLNRKVFFQHDSRDEIFSNLLLILEASNTTLYEHIESLSINDEYLKKLLILHEQAECSINEYKKSISK